MKHEISAEFVLSVHNLNQTPRNQKPHIAFGGRSNVGKSTLINTILSKKGLAKTSSTPGRTQALNFFDINDSFYVVDLPGYGHAKAPVAIKKAWGKLTDSYLTSETRLAGVVALIDSRHDPTADDLSWNQWLAEREIPVVIALTKTDKLSGNQLARRLKSLESSFSLQGEIVKFSAVSGLGKKELWKWILTCVQEA